MNASNTTKGDPLMTKKEMLAEMDEAAWGSEFDEDSSYEDVKADYEEMKKENSDNSTWYPNGRDYDAEDEDGI